MVFNYLIENKDDHAKNFAFILRNKEWFLSPAFDILAGDGINGYHTTSINDSIIPTKQDLLTVAEKVGLETKKATEIFNEMFDIINSSPIVNNKLSFL
jgi:serine/threonine-protein kinase HipA